MVVFASLLVEHLELLQIFVVIVHQVQAPEDKDKRQHEVEPVDARRVGVGIAGAAQVGGGELREREALGIVAAAIQAIAGEIHRHHCKRWLLQCVLTHTCKQT